MLATCLMGPANRPLYKESIVLYITEMYTCLEAHEVTVKPIGTEFGK